MTLRVDREGSVAILTIDRPDVRNALDAKTGEELTNAWLDFRDDDELPLEEGLRLEQLLAEPVRQSENAREGPQAFLEKRRPEFKGR